MPIADRLILGRTLAQHIGGRWAISWIAYVINLPINMLGTLSNVVDARSAPLGAWWLMWAASYASLGAVLLLANVTVFRHRRQVPVPMWWVVVLGAIAGGIRGAVVGVLADAWGLSGGGMDLVATRILTGALLGAIMIPAAALLLSIIASYSMKRRELLDEIVELERQRMQVEGESQRLRTLLAADIQANAQRLSENSQLRSARDISHRMWNESFAVGASRRGSIGWRSVLADVFVNYPYPGIAVAAIWAVSAVGTLVTTIGVARGLSQWVFSIAVIVGVFALAARIHPRSHLFRVVLLVSTLTAVTFITGPFASSIFDPRPLGAGNGQLIANSIWLPILALIIGVIISAIRSSEEVLARLSSEMREEEVAALAASHERAHILREMAETLHGIQSRIFSARAVGSEVVLSDLLSEAASDPHAKFEELLSTWGVLMDVRVDQPLATLSDDDVIAVHRVVSEALSNAYRHGSASSCDIRIDADLASVSIEVIDNGSGVLPVDETGLGSRILDSVCDGEWSLVNAPGGGAVLHARINRQ